MTELTLHFEDYDQTGYLIRFGHKEHLEQILNGKIKKNDFVKFVSTEKEYHADEIGVLKLDMVPRVRMSAGEVGYIISGIKTSKEVKVGDTITFRYHYTEDVSELYGYPHISVNSITVKS